MIEKWSEVKSIESMSIYLNSGFSNATLYANGEHQIEVNVNIKPYNENVELLKVDSSMIFDNIKIVDFENREIPSNIITISQVKGPFVTPIPVSDSESTMLNTDNSNTCKFYLSVSEILESPYKICVSLFLSSGYEYSTSEFNNNNNINPSYISLSTLTPIEFSNSDIEISYKVDKEVVYGYNDELYKYYVRFRNKNNIKTHYARGDEIYWFFYEQDGNYKACATSTDMLVTYNDNAYCQVKFGFTDSWEITVNAKNHEEIGVCFWGYRVWYGALWSYHTWDKNYQFTLFDQYGNSAKIKVNASGNQQEISQFLTFKITK
ncbi:transferase [Xenorhabdus stockiae]|uniref:transferase n=1 Tax=Xenorhabdus stockiae TaxID=351614 RepID=UPI00406356CE